MPESNLRRAAESIRTRVSSSLATLGFTTARSGTWTRERDHVIEYVLISRVADQALLRVQCGVRVLNDPAQTLVPNGPDSDRHRGRGADFQLGFGISEPAQDACVADLVRFCLVIADPWLVAARDERRLHALLSPSEQAALASSLASGIEQARAAWSRRLVGIIAPK